MSRLDEIKARIEEDRDTSEHCIDIDHADWLVSEIERLRAALRLFYSPKSEHYRAIPYEGQEPWCRKCEETWPCRQMVARAALAAQGDEQQPEVDRIPVCVECGERAAGNRVFRSEDGAIWRCADGCDQGGTPAADYIRTEAERLPNGTAARFLAALDAMDGATEPGQPGSAYPRDGRAEMKAKIKPTTIDDTEVSGVILTITADKFGSKITVESLALPHLNRDFYFTADGRFDGTGTMVSSGSDDGLGETGEPG